MLISPFFAILRRQFKNCRIANGHINNEKVRQFLLVLLLAFSPASFAAIHVAQTAQGTADGSSCANARSASWFNSLGSWGSGSTQINPGNLVKLCGVITTDLTFRGNGTPGNYITVDGTDATMSASFMATARISYGKIQNAKWVNNFGRTLFKCLSCDNFVFTHTSVDNWHGYAWVYLVEDGVTQLPHHITISHNYVRTSSENFGDTQTDIFVCAGCADVVLEGNHMEMRIVGAYPSSNSHNDVMQTFQKGGSSMGYPSNLTVRHNKIVMNTADRVYDRSWCMLEMLGGTNNIHDNLFLGLSGADGSNGCNVHGSQSNAVFNFFGNTMVSKGSASNNQLNLQGAGTANISNNIFYAAGNQGWTLGMSRINRSNNLWYGLRAPSCTGSNEICNRDPLFADYNGNNFALQPGSPAANAGTTLLVPFNKALVPNAIWPNPILAQRSGSWPIGAFLNAGNSTVTIAAPTNLRVVP